jgi:hypothetical protein
MSNVRVVAPILGASPAKCTQEWGQMSERCPESRPLLPHVHFVGLVYKYVHVSMNGLCSRHVEIGTMYRSIYLTRN